MKAVKVVSLLIAIIFISAAFVSCGSSSTGIKIRVAAIKVSPDGDKTLICPVIEGEVKTESPTVMDAALEVFEQNNISKKVDEDLGIFLVIKNNKAETKNGLVWNWDYKLNGKDAPGKSIETYVNDGDYIVFYLTADDSINAVDEVKDDAEDNGDENEDNGDEENQEDEDNG